MIKLHDGPLILTIHRRYAFLSLDVMQLLFEAITICKYHGEC